MRCFLNGELLPIEEARVPVTDRGFLYGDSLFETARVYAGRALFLDDHLDRLEAGVRLLGFTMPVTRLEIEAACHRLLAANAVGDGVLRIALTRGSGARGPNPAGAHSPTLLITTSALPVDLETRAVRGYRLIVSEWRKPSPHVLPNTAKTGNYLNSILAMQEAAEREADEAMVLDGEGHIAECSHSNLFFVERGALLTPSLASGALKGTARARVIALARDAGIRVEERTVSLDIVAASQEAFVTNAVVGIMPVAAIEAVTFDVPGTMTARLRALWEELVRTRSEAESIN